MNNKEFAMHVNAGTFYGEQATCQYSKVDRKSELSAKHQAALESARLKKDMEAYPCAWCDGWHIGRKMTETERFRFHPDTMNYEVPLAGHYSW